MDVGEPENGVIDFSELCFSRPWNEDTGLRAPLWGAGEREEKMNEKGLHAWPAIPPSVQGQGAGAFLVTSSGVWAAEMLGIGTVDVFTVAPGQRTDDHIVSLGRHPPSLSRASAGCVGEAGGSREGPSVSSLQRKGWAGVNTKRDLFALLLASPSLKTKECAWRDLERACLASQPNFLASGWYGQRRDSL